MTIYTRGGFALPGTSVEFKTGSWRLQRPLHRHRDAPCHTACPAGEDAQAYLARFAEGRLQEAWETIAGANPLPAITGRVCDHPCESGCNRGMYDDPIAIHNVERFLGDMALSEGWAYPVTAPARGAVRVAVVGAGPGGLSAAYHLFRRGYRVTLLDALPEAGGTLRTALPAYRLPRDILEREIERLLAIGITFLPQHMLGRDVSLEELRADHEAVFLAPGRQQSREWSVQGSVPRDLHTGIEVLQDWISMGSVPQVSSAAIVGGGNTAVDLARILRRAGAEAHVITHNALPGPDAQPDDMMAALPREVAQAMEEGVVFHEHRGIRRLILRGEKVVGVEMVRMKKLRRPDGTLDRVGFEGTETVLHVDQVIPAIGQDVAPDGMEGPLGRKPFFETDAWGRVAGHDGIFDGGDARFHSRGTVSGAVGDGRRAAEAIDRLLRGLALPEEGTAEAIAFEKINLHYYEHAPRAREPVLPVEQRTGCQEIERGLNSEQVAAEAARCFSCGTCFACDNCWTLCPDEAVLKTKELASDGSHYVFDYDYCKGCGLCAHECPCGFIAMEDEI